MLNAGLSIYCTTVYNDIPDLPVSASTYLCKALAIRLTAFVVAASTKKISINNLSAGLLVHPGKPTNTFRSPLYWARLSTSPQGAAIPSNRIS